MPKHNKTINFVKDYNTRRLFIRVYEVYSNSSFLEDEDMSYEEYYAEESWEDFMSEGE